MTISLCVVIPVLNEAPTLAVRLANLEPLRQRGVRVVVADGGSHDTSVDVAHVYADQVVCAARGRGAQMNAGAKACAADHYLFLHADTQLPANTDALLAQAAREGAIWGRFDVRIDSPLLLLRVVETLMNWRSRLSGIATGDQALFVRGDAFWQVGGFADIALMEDIELSRRLKRIAAPTCLKAKVLTSGRRWEQHGVWRTIWLMWRLRAAYALGADPHDLAVRYGYRPRQP